MCDVKIIDVVYKQSMPSMRKFLKTIEFDNYELSNKLDSRGKKIVAVRSGKETKVIFPCFNSSLSYKVQLLLKEILQERELTTLEGEYDV